MDGIRSLETLYDAKRGRLVPLPMQLTELYGQLYMPCHEGRPHVITDYVATLDGVVSLSPLGTPVRRRPGEAAPGAVISGFNAADLMILALLHAIADVLIIGDVGLMGNPGDVRTAEKIYPALADTYRRARTDLGKPAMLPVAVISPKGDVDLGMPIFHLPDARVAIMTSESTAALLERRGLPPTTRVVAVPTEEAGLFSARSILDAIAKFQPSELILSDAGPRFTTHLIAEKCLDEFFLTVAPQIAGRDSSHERPGFAAGKLFLPGDARWAELISVKRAEHHLFFRYAL